MENQVLYELRDMMVSLTKKVDRMEQNLDEHGKRLDEHSDLLKEHSQILKGHTETLKEHGQILSALRNGDVLKAEIEGMKLDDAKQLADLKERTQNNEASAEVLKKDIWENKLNMQRMQTAMGMK